jgi:hypothetical protein
VNQTNRLLADDPSCPKSSDDLHLIERIPHVVDSLFGTHTEISRALAKTLTNSQLLGALKVEAGRQVHTFYVDIDLQLGGATSHEFFLMRPRGTRLTYELSASEWQTFKDFEHACRLFGQQTLTSDEDAVAQAWEQRQNALREWTRVEIAARNSVQHVRSVFTESERLLDIKRRELRDPHYRQLQGELNQLPAPKDKDKPDPHAARRLQLRQQLTRLDAPAAPLERTVKLHREDLSKAVEEHNHVLRQRPLETYPVEAEGSSLAAALLAEQKRTDQSIRRYSKTLPDSSELGKFLQQCSKLSADVADLLRFPYGRELLGIGREPQAVSDSQSNRRLCVPLDKMIDTRINLWVFGDAGAGKTTGLQYYAWRCLSEDSGRLALYVPLSRLVRTAPMRLALDSESTSDLIQESVAAYLGELGVSIGGKALVEQLKTRHGVLLLDGIDEAVVLNPGIVGAIANFAREHPSVQVVTSSRIAAGLRDPRAFLGLTLLPFTDEQRMRFVTDWFGETAKDVASRVLQHCEEAPSLAEVVRTPLNATILCVLADRGLPLPSTESHLYRSRLELLISEYDLHKGIQRVRSERVHLELTARKLAYWLHQRSLRHASMSELLAVAKKIQVPGTIAETAAYELLDPCNVLVPMTQDGMVGFGHLRYQEFLVALDLISDRGNDIVSKLNKPWWHGALHLMAEMSQSLTWLMDLVVHEERTTNARGVLEVMFRAGPAAERETNLKMLSRYASQADDDINWNDLS